MVAKNLFIVRCHFQYAIFESSRWQDRRSSISICGSKNTQRSSTRSMSKTMNPDEE
uniref:Uncharacterized protein n=1 Tax=Tetranychus urticae TaxID=32264 RepID=T1KVD9_TETUR